AACTDRQPAWRLRPRSRGAADEVRPSSHTSNHAYGDRQDHPDHHDPNHDLLETLVVTHGYIDGYGSSTVEERDSSHEPESTRLGQDLAGPARRQSDDPLDGVGVDCTTDVAQLQGQAPARVPQEPAGRDGDRGPSRQTRHAAAEAGGKARLSADAQSR